MSSARPCMCSAPCTARKLCCPGWGCAGLTLRHHDDEERLGRYVERVGAGALQPAPSWHNLRDRRTTKVSAGAAAATAVLTAAAAAAALF